MGEFNYKKFLTENRLTYTSREVYNNELNEALNSLNLENLTRKELIEGAKLVKSLNLNLDNELNEGLKDFVGKVKSKLKGLKPKEQLLSVLFAKMKKILPSGVNIKDVIKDLIKASKEIEGKITKEKFLNWAEKNTATNEAQQLN
jgi:hypothetical protein